MNKILLLIICNLSILNGFAQWQEANNRLYGGDVKALAIDITANYVYAGTNGGGVFLSANNGTSWTVKGIYFLQLYNSNNTIKVERKIVLL